MELRLRVDDHLMNKLKHLLRYVSNGEVIGEALTLLEWAVEETQKGRQIQSSDGRVITTEGLSRVRND